jgi:acyl-CoA thioester hydrolase
LNLAAPFDSEQDHSVIIFSWPIRIYYEDTDMGGVVYYANYLRFYERARTEWLRSLGFEQTRLKNESGIVFAVRHVEIDYLKPARLDDALTVETQVSAGGRISIDFHQRLLCGDTVLSNAKIQVVSLDSIRFRPAAIPRPLRECIDAQQ